LSTPTPLIQRSPIIRDAAVGPAGRPSSVRYANYSVRVSTRLVDTVPVITLPEAPRLVWPIATVRTSYLVGEQADCLLRGTDTDWLGPASEDFEAFVDARRGVKQRWAVPTTMFWYVSGDRA
jgi:hypothetical protein